eukprot:2206480-Prorocentrum_lima.AAC.1
MDDWSMMFDSSSSSSSDSEEEEAKTDASRRSLPRREKRDLKPLESTMHMDFISASAGDERALESFRLHYRVPLSVFKDVLDLVEEIGF